MGYYTGDLMLEVAEEPLLQWYLRLGNSLIIRRQSTALQFGHSEIVLGEERRGTE